MRRFVLSMFGLLFALSAYAATDLTAEAVNAAQPTERSKGAKTIDPLTIKAQVLLDRAHFSPRWQIWREFPEGNTGVCSRTGNGFGWQPDQRGVGQTFRIVR